MERGASDSEVTCGITPTPQSSQQLTKDVTVCIKQETAEDHCVRNAQSFGEVEKDNCGNFDVSLVKVECNDAQERYATLNYGLQSTFNEYEDRGSLSPELSTSTMKPVKNEDDRHGSEPWSVFSSPGRIKSPTQVKKEEECKIEVEDQVLCRFQPRSGEQEAYDKGSDDCKRAEHSASDVDETGKPHAGKSVDTCDIKAEYDADLNGQAGSERRSQAEEFVCFKCGYSVTKRGCLTKHMKRYHNDTIQKRFKTKGLSVKTKAQRSFAANLYRCAECDFTGKSKNSLTRHATVNHKSDGPVHRRAERSLTTKQPSAHIEARHNRHAEVHRCPSCDFSTKYKKNLTQHLMIMHNINAKVYTCTNCNFTTKLRHSLNNHVKIHHSLNAPVYECAECGYKTKRKGDLSIHTSVHNEHGQLHKCPHCDFASKYKQSLIQHLKRHDPNAEVYKCTDCNFTTKLRISFNSHVKTFHGLNVAVYKCAECSYTTQRKASLSAHIKGRHDEHAELHKCPRCDYATKHKHSLTKHFSVLHDPDAKVYTCTDCNFTTKRRQNLNIHVNVYHSVDAPVYECAECSYTTKRKDSLSAHFNVHHNEHAELYKCPHCDHVSKSKYSSVQHLKVQHDPDAKVYKCTACSYTSKYKQCLTGHVTRKHGSDGAKDPCAK